MFRILIVDDDPAVSHLLNGLMQDVRHAHELHFAGDGVDALDFLHGRGDRAGAPRPNLILLDVNMPRLGGLETLSAIKTDPQLSTIPVIMLSTSGQPRDVCDSYLFHAACYVEKPANLERSVKLVKAIEAFWMDFACLCGGENCQASDHKRINHPALSREGNSGPAIANGIAEVRSPATMSSDDSTAKGTPSTHAGCAEHARLLDEFGVAVRELLELHQQQFQAISGGEDGSERFDILIHTANEKKQLAKYAYLRHLDQHGCSKL
jgi:two-component system, chemotaxis family, response regulator Rcp1